MQKDTDHQQPIGKTSATIELECSESKTKQPSANATVRTKGPVAFEYHMYHIHQIALLRQFALLSNWIYNLTLLLALLLSISLHFLPLDVSLSCIPQHAQKK
jgi:hypothetical protein